MKKRITCPHCQQHYEIDESEIAGFNEMTCNSCNKDFQLAGNVSDVPEPKAETPKGIAANAGKTKSKAESHTAMLSIISAIMFILAGLSFFYGYEELHKEYGFPSNRKSYDYYGDLIPHLHYKATVELLGEVQLSEYFIRYGTRKIQGTLYMLISALFFSSGCMTLVMRKKMTVQQSAMSEFRKELLEAIKERK